MTITELIEKLKEYLNTYTQPPWNFKDPTILCYDRNGMSTTNFELYIDDGGKDGYLMIIGNPM